MPDPTNALTPAPESMGWMTPENREKYNRFLGNQLDKALSDSSGRGNGGDSGPYSDNAHPEIPGWKDLGLSARGDALWAAGKPDGAADYTTKPSAPAVSPTEAFAQRMEQRVPGWSKLDRAGRHDAMMSYVKGDAWNDPAYKAATSGELTPVAGQPGSFTTPYGTTSVGFRPNAQTAASDKSFLSNVGDGDFRAPTSQDHVTRLAPFDATNPSSVFSNTLQAIAPPAGKPAPAFSLTQFPAPPQGAPPLVQGSQAPSPTTGSQGFVGGLPIRSRAAAAFLDPVAWAFDASRNLVTGVERLFSSRKPWDPNIDLSKPFVPSKPWEKPSLFNR